MRELHIALGLLKQGETYLLQHRVHKDSSGGTGLIGCFGGKIEDEEDIAAACREVAEETNDQYRPRPDDATLLGEFDVTSDYRGQPTRVYGTAFLFELEPSVQIEKVEGELVRVTKEELLGLRDRLTPGTLAVVDQLL